MCEARAWKDDTLLLGRGEGCSLDWIGFDLILYEQSVNVNKNRQCKQLNIPLF